MTRFEAPTRLRRRGLAATALVIVVALLALGAPIAAHAQEVGTGPGTISGTITTTDGQPIEGIFVTVSVSIGQGTSFSAYTFSDASGHYGFSGLDASSYDISVYSSNHQSEPSLTAVLSEAAPNATADFALAPFVVGVGTISGQVTADGQPLAGQWVSINNYTTAQSSSATSDENGFYEFTGLGNGTWSVSSFGGSQYQFLNARNVEITDAAPNGTVDLAFLSYPTGTSSITGVLTDAATGAPIQGASVSLYGIDVAQISNTSSDELGGFTFADLPAGSYGLNFFAPGYLAPSTEVAVAEGATATADQAFVATNASISGHVSGPGGAPVANEYVDAHTSGGAFAGAFTDANGDYVITGVGAVEYTLSIGGPGTPYDRVQRAVTPIANETITEDFELVARTTGTLGGMVLSPDGEYYSAPVCATLYSSKNKKPLANVATYGPNYGDGTYAFNDLKPGTYTVEFRDCDDDPTTKFDKVFLGGAKNFKDATFVTIAAAQDSHDNLVTLTPRGH